MPQFLLENISCPACSQKIEDALRKLPEFSGIVFNHLTGAVTTSGQTGLQQLKQAVLQIDSEVRVRPTTVPLPEQAHQDKFAALIVSTVLLITSAFFEEALARTGLGILTTAGFAWAYLLAGLPVLARTGRALLRGDFFNEYFLMSLATAGAILIGSFPEAVSVMLFFRIGEMVEGRALARSRRSVSALLATQPASAVVLRGSRQTTVAPDDVAVGETLIVRPGEKIPLDGRILRGRSQLDCSSLTGESLPCGVGKGKTVRAGSINLTGLLTIRVEKEYKDSSIVRILQLVQSAAEKKTSTERFLTRFARIYTPVVVLLALGLAFLPPLLLPGAALGDWVYRALVLLVISCPCALLISIPLGYFGGIGAASRQGILIKGSIFLDRLRNLDTVAFDKTGTLTEGRLRLTKTIPAAGINRRELLGYAALAEAHSTHPIAEAVRRAAGKRSAAAHVTSHREIAGMGVIASSGGKRIIAGNERLFRRERIACPDTRDEGIVMHLAVNRRYLGRLVIADNIRPGAKAALSALRKMGVERIVMLSGDSPASAAGIAARLGLTDVRAGLLPEDKVRELERLMAAAGGTTAFVGDGTNDAPVLARADLGVALGGIGSDAAIETADMVILGEDPGKLAVAVRLARRTQRTIRQNIAMAFSVKLFFLIGAAFGIPSLWEAVFADVGVALLAILNASHLLRHE